MKTKTIRAFGAAALAALYLGLAAFAWLREADAVSEAERRKLAQMPQLSVSSVLSGSFMAGFEDYSLDQFPLRDGFRGLKSRFHYAIGQLDNNGIYITDGYAAKVEYPLDGSSVDRALGLFRSIYDTYLREAGCTVLASVVPDKGCYLARENGYLSLDYDALTQQVREGMPYAYYVNLFDTLTLADYYRTDTHWRQEALLGAAAALCDALGVTAPQAEDYTQVAAERPFYGVYHGQAALPMEPDTLVMLQSGLLDRCAVRNPITGAETAVYDTEKLSGRDMYDVFLSGAQALLTIENPDAETDRELVIFRDSFGSAIAPLLVQGYKTVTLVDIRYIASEQLEAYLDFSGKDVLFLYSTQVLNNSTALK